MTKKAHKELGWTQATSHLSRPKAEIVEFPKRVSIAIVVAHHHSNQIQISSAIEIKFRNEIGWFIDGG